MQIIYLAHTGIFLWNVLLTVFSHYLTSLSGVSGVWIKWPILSDNSNDHPVFCSYKLSSSILHNNVMTTLAAAAANEKLVMP